MAKKRPASRKRTAARRKPPPPPGWTAVEDLPPPVPEPKPDLLSEIRESVRTTVAAGYSTPREAMRSIVAMYEDQAPATKIRRLAKPIFDEERSSLESQQARWPKVTDNDRLDAAFADLESRGILARQNYWCCGTCGCAAIDDEIRKLKRRKRPVRGYTFFHQQDTESAVGGYGLMLNYGSDNNDRAASVAIGREIAKVLRAHKLRVTWNGDLNYRIGVKLDWKRRLRPANK